MGEMAAISSSSVRVGVVAPGGRITPELADRVLAFAAGLDLARAVDLRFHPQCFASCGHFAGSDAERADALVSVANDPDFDAVWFARGGYGSFRLVEAVLPRLNAVARAKTYLGYSDTGALLGAFYGARIGTSAHGPMPSDLNRPGGEAAVLRALAFLVAGEAAANPAPAAAFNITILAHLIGTPYMPDLAGHVLMLEDVSEPLYRIDRAFGQITSAPAIRRVAGIMLGRCSAIVANEPEFGQTEVEIARYWCERAGIPYLGRADIGHDADNTVVPFGQEPYRFK
jgi:muramoyltetrapeptide carboxypeptidase